MAIIIIFAVKTIVLIIKIMTVITIKGMDSVYPFKTKYTNSIR